MRPDFFCEIQGISIGINQGPGKMNVLLFLKADSKK